MCVDEQRQCADLGDRALVQGQLMPFVCWSQVNSSIIPYNQYCINYFKHRGYTLKMPITSAVHLKGLPKTGTTWTEVCMQSSARVCDTLTVCETMGGVVLSSCVSLPPPPPAHHGNLPIGGLAWSPIFPYICPSTGSWWQSLQFHAASVGPLYRIVLPRHCFAS